MLQVLKRRARAVAATATIGAALLASGAASANITYLVDQAFGDGSVRGTLVTDGALGFLSSGDFSAWDLTLTGAGGVTYNLTQANSGVFIQGSDVAATPTEITFDFSQDSQSYFLIEGVFGSGMHYWCNASQSGVCNQGKSSVPESFDSPSAVYAAASGNQVIASSVPEPATWALMAIGFAGVGFAAWRRAQANPAKAIG